MASRIRNRQPPPKDDADEERSIWVSLRAEGNRVDSMVAECNIKWNRQVEIKDILEEQYRNGQVPDDDLEDELMKLSRENVKLCEDIQSAIAGSSENDMSSILGSLKILSALRASSELDSHAPPPPRAASSAKPLRNTKRKGESSSVLSVEDRDSLAADSPVAGPSPKVSVPNATRLKVHASSSRAGSVPAVRETSVKIEDGSESGLDVDRPKYIRGAEVFYRYKKGTQRDRSQDRDDQGEGILCTITNVIGEGKQRRYEILDVEPEEGASPYRASLQQMTAIPAANEGLPDAQPRRTVLAMYPGTTTFYRAEVVAVKGKEIPPGHVRLRFEGEDEKDKEMDVEKRYVLLEWSGR